MIKVKIHPKVRVRFKSDLHKLIKIKEILEKRGFQIARFGSAGISFYKSEDCVNNEVPINKFYFMAHKEFGMLVQELAKLNKLTANVQINRLGNEIRSPL
jgi:hypothetical protein